MKGYDRSNRLLDRRIRWTFDFGVIRYDGATGYQVAMIWEADEGRTPVGDRSFSAKDTAR